MLTRSYPMQNMEKLCGQYFSYCLIESFHIILVSEELVRIVCIFFVLFFLWTFFGLL